MEIKSISTRDCFGGELKFTEFLCNNPENISDLHEKAIAENTGLLDRIEAYAEMMEMELDCGNTKKVREILRQLQRLVWSEHERIG